MYICVMARIPIKPKDKVQIIQKVAQGASFREAMEGTSIKSTQTVKAIVDSESNKIEQIKLSFAEKMEQRERLKDEALLNDLEEGLQSYKLGPKGETVTDFNAKHNWWKDAMQLKGHLQQSPLGVQVNNFLIDRTNSIDVE